MSRRLSHGRSLLALSMVSAVLALASGCDTIGNGRALAAGAQGLPQSIVVNRSRREEVRLALGDASVYHYATGAQSWTYRQTQGLPRFVKFVPYLSLATLAVPPKVVEVALLFDPQGILRRVEWRTST